jgi:hypothetical protein
MKLTLLVILFLSAFAIHAQPKKKSDELAELKLRNWLDKTKVYFPFGSIKTLFEQDFRKSELFKQFNIQFLDSSHSWGVIELNKVIAFKGKQDHDFWFEINTDNYQTAAFQNNVIRIGFIHGVNTMDAVFRRVMLYSDSGTACRLFLDRTDGDYHNLTHFYWDDHLMIMFNKGFGGNSMVNEEWSKFNNQNTPLPTSGEFLANTIRDCVEVPQKYLTLSFSEYESAASLFLEDHYRKLYPTHFGLVSKTPPTVYLKGVKGYISENYWEKTQVIIDNVQKQGACLLIQCTIAGDFIKNKTPAYEEDAFRNSIPLEESFLPEIQAKGHQVIDSFKLFLINSK